jgi:hypothetical protein
MDSRHSTMQHLAYLGAVESTSIGRRNELVQSNGDSLQRRLAWSRLDDIRIFLYVQYESNKDEVKEKRIPFKPTTWYSATQMFAMKRYGARSQPC